MGERFCRRSATQECFVWKASRQPMTPAPDLWHPTIELYMILLFRVNVNARGRLGRPARLQHQPRAVGWVLAAAPCLAPCPLGSGRAHPSGPPSPTRFTPAWPPSGPLSTRSGPCCTSSGRGSTRLSNSCWRSRCLSHRADAGLGPDGGGFCHADTLSYEIVARTFRDPPHIGQASPSGSKPFMLHRDLRPAASGNVPCIQR